MAAAFQYQVVENDGRKEWVTAQFVLLAHAEAFAEILRRSGYRGTWTVVAIRHPARR